MGIDAIPEKDRALQILLKERPLPKKAVEIPFGTEQLPITLKGLTSFEVEKIRENCTEKRERKGRIIETLDNARFNTSLIVAATEAPNWRAPELLAKYQAHCAEDVLGKIFMAGELSALGDVVLSLSGFNLDLDDVKN
jgi:hypothetical protein